MAYKISVLMSVYYKEKPEYFRASIDSILNQTYTADEIVIVCDGPLTNDLNDIIEYYRSNDQENIFKIIRLQENRGLGNALSIGLLECSNEYVARMDSDDIATNNRFERQIEIFKQNQSIDLIGSNIQEFCDDAIRTKRIVPENNVDIYKFMKKRCPFNHMTVMMKKSKALDSGNYQHLLYNEDYYLWIRMAKNNCVFYNIQEVLVYARINDETFKRRGGIKYFKSEKMIFKIMLKNKQINIFRYFYNVLLRFVVEIMIPNKLRSYLFKRFVRE